MYEACSSPHHDSPYSLSDSARARASEPEREREREREKEKEREIFGKDKKIKRERVFIQ